VISTIVKLLRFASIVICVIVIASFAIFVVGQTKSASKHQVEAVRGRPSVTTSTHKSSLHKAIDEAAQELTSPFAGIVSGSSSEWVIRSVKLLLALAVYGFGLGFLARALRVRA
jgi:hypothetical protein